MTQHSTEETEQYSREEIDWAYRKSVECSVRAESVLAAFQRADRDPNAAKSIANGINDLIESVQEIVDETSLSAFSAIREANPYPAEIGKHCGESYVDCVVTLVRETYLTILRMTNPASWRAVCSSKKTGDPKADWSHIKPIHREQLDSVVDQLVQRHELKANLKSLSSRLLRLHLNKESRRVIG
ncbi:MAG: hypothetical protein AAF266_02410, partial [Planctomycetota bacterium]